MYPLGNIIKGEWQRESAFTDYRTESLTNVVVERATWHSETTTRPITPTVAASAGSILLRFWLLEDEVLVEKHYDSQGNAVGYYIPICMPIKRRSDHLEAYSLLLALWVEPDDRVTVLHEESFEQAVTNGEITPVEAEHAEFRIRELTAALTRKQFPPGLVRKFEIEL